MSSKCLDCHLNLGLQKSNWRWSFPHDLAKCTGWSPLWVAYLQIGSHNCAAGTFFHQPRVRGQYYALCTFRFFVFYLWICHAQVNCTGLVSLFVHSWNVFLEESLHSSDLQFANNSICALCVHYEDTAHLVTGGQWLCVHGHREIYLIPCSPGFQQILGNSR